MHQPKSKAPYGANEAKIRLEAVDAQETADLSRNPALGSEPQMVPFHLLQKKESRREPAGCNTSSAYVPGRE